MIESVTVTDLEKALEFSRQKFENNFSAWITAIDHEDEKYGYNIERQFSYRNVPALVRYFKDFDDSDEVKLKISNFEFHAPSKADVEVIVDFIRGLVKDEKPIHLGINCYAGRSRSTAIAMIAWMESGYKPDVSLYKVLEKRAIAYPNERILRFYDEITGNTDSAKVVNQWKKDSFVDNGNGIIVNSAWLK